MFRDCLRQYVALPPPGTTIADIFTGAMGSPYDITRAGPQEKSAVIPLRPSYGPQSAPLAPRRPYISGTLPVRSRSPPVKKRPKTTKAPESAPANPEW
jgi:hypothetical protein